MLTVAFAFGLSVVAMAYAIGGISGCHINPAFTLGCMLSGRMKSGEGATDSKKGAGSFAGLAIGLSLVLVHIVCIPITGTSVNPARSIAPAVFQGGEALSQLWIFIVAPFVGAALSALVWKLIGSECEGK